MASAPQPNLPLFYNDLMPINSQDHSTWKLKQLDSAPWLGNQHAVPLTVEEFPEAQRNYPIVFSSGDNPLPLALMGLNEGVNTFFGEDGRTNEDIYVPAYIRRYPFILAKLQQGSDEMSLCFDPTAGAVGDFEEGDAIFDSNSQPTDATKGVLEFCQRFEEAGMRTKNFIDEITKEGLLMEGEIAITQNDQPDKPFVYRGFQMINQEKLREVRGDKLRAWNQNGLISMIYAHLFSLNLMRSVFGRQVAQGKMPPQEIKATI
ncbi:MAG: SapC family protein [Sphingomonadaceae bacterium]|nr:SapC family protein [Sphingomonadaceae bacterium]